MFLDQDWLFSSEEYICGIRTVGVLIKGNKILVQRDKGGNEYALPGGHIKIGETLENGLLREFKEETGITIKVDHLLWREECFWEYNEKQAHNIAFYFLIDKCCASEFPDNKEFVSHKDNCNVLIGWMPIEKLKNIVIYPKFLKDEIFNISGEIKHFISNG